jgi:hypothetical protein
MVAGMMLHVMTAVVFGVAFVLVARRTVAANLALATPGFWPLAIAGMAFIVAEWLVASFLILPLVDRPLLATFASIGGLAAHLMFGIVLAGWLAWRSAPAAILVRSSSQQRGAA